MTNVIKVLVYLFIFYFKINSLKHRAGNMGQARWADPNWPDILEGRAMKLATRKIYIYVTYWDFFSKSYSDYTNEDED